MPRVAFSALVPSVVWVVGVLQGLQLGAYHCLARAGGQLLHIVLVSRSVVGLLRDPCLLALSNFQCLV